MPPISELPVQAQYSGSGDAYCLMRDSRSPKPSTQTMATRPSLAGVRLAICGRRLGLLSIPIVPMPIVVAVISFALDVQGVEYGTGDLC